MEKILDVATLLSVNLFMNGKYTIQRTDVELQDGRILSHMLTGDDLLVPVAIVIDHKNYSATSYLYDNDEGLLSPVPGDLLRDKVTDIVFELVEQIKEGMENRKEE